MCEPISGTYFRNLSDAFFGEILSLISAEPGRGLIAAYHSFPAAGPSGASAVS